MNATQKAVNESSNLIELCNILNEYEPADEYATLDTVVDLPGLPTFGGVDPTDTREVWSWDAENVLLFDGVYYVEKRDPEAWYDKNNAKQNHD